MSADWDFGSVAVIGAGAIGLYYGGRLATLPGADVRFLVRSDFDGLRHDGLNVTSVHGDFSLPTPQVFRNANEIGPVDLVVITWKATSNPALEHVLPPLLHANTQVLTLQNGLGNCEAIARIVGPERVLGGLCFVCINRLRPGHVNHSAGGRVDIGTWSSNGFPGRAERIAERFRAAGVRGATAVDDLEQAQWEKLVWNVPFNGLSVAEGGVTTDILLDSPATEAEIRALMSEVIAAGNALGLTMTDELIDYNINRTRPMGPYRTSSMIDFVEGREIELDPIWQEPIRRAQAVGVAVPHTENLLRRIRQQCAARPIIS